MASTAKRITLTKSDCIVGADEIFDPFFESSLFDPHLIELQRHNYDRLEDFALNGKLSIMKRVIAKDGRKGLKPSGYAGIIMLKDGTQIELLPEISGDFNVNQITAKTSLLKMLDSMREIPIRTTNELYFKNEKLNLFEICVKMFADEVLTVVRNGLKQAYMPYQGNEMFVKGKTLYSMHAKKNYAHKEKFYVEYDIFVSNRAENRLIKSTLDKLYDLSSNTLNKKKLKMLLISFDEVDYSSNYSHDFSLSIDDRSMSKYSGAMKWCKFFLMNNPTFFTGGKITYAMLFPLDKLFSGLVAEKLRLTLDRTKYYFLTPEKTSNVITYIKSETGDSSGIYIKDKNTGDTISLKFRFSEASEEEENDAITIFPVTGAINNNMRDRGPKKCYIDLNDIEKSVSVLTETFFA
jgi:5-methylcytosine-specific restriction enzyme subunit McrC